MVRLPNILQRVIEENDFSAAIVAKLKSLAEEIPYAKLKPLANSNAPDAIDWSEFLKPYLEFNWLEIPWFLAETYFYRRVLDEIGYFNPTADGYQVDPYSYQKRQGLQTSIDAIAQLSTQLNNWSHQSEAFEPLADLFRINLWGNQADYSLWPANESGQPRHTDLQKSLNHIVVDDTADVINYLSRFREQPARIDFIVDNAGFELVSDLAFSDFVLRTALAATVVLHLKSHPTFVSDATEMDVEQSIAFLANDSNMATSQFGQRLGSYRSTDRLILQHHYFWTSPLGFWEMPNEIRRDLRQSNLVISKGDANYRRLLGDRHWPYTTPFADIVSYAPAPLVASRTFKSEVVCGLNPKQIEALYSQDQNWLSNGKYGVIQFVG
jgi:hypothetical protein